MHTLSILYTVIACDGTHLSIIQDAAIITYVIERRARMALKTFFNGKDLCTLLPAVFSKSLALLYELLIELVDWQMMIDKQYIQSPAKYIFINKFLLFSKQFPIATSQMVSCNKPSGAVRLSWHEHRAIRGVLINSHITTNTYAVTESTHQKIITL